MAPSSPLQGRRCASALGTDGVPLMGEEKCVEIEINDDLRKRVESHLASMDQYAIGIVRAAAEIEAILSEAIKSKFVNQIQLRKVVGESFGRVISLSFALGLVRQKTYECLLKLQGLRNDIAHSISHPIKIRESLNLVMFLGSEAENKVQELASNIASREDPESALALCHKAALQLLVQKVKDDVMA